MKQSAVERRAMKREGSDTSSFHQAQEDRSAKAKATEGEVNLRHYVTKLGLPSGLQPAIESAYHDTESRIWIVDNSLDMNVKDSNLIFADEKLEKITKEVGASRWSEQLQCVDFHLKMAARTWMPTKFWMINNPGHHPQRYGVCWGDPSNWAAERDNASKIILKELKPEQESNPLGPEVLRVVKKLEPVAALMKNDGKFVSVVICTQGVPRNELGESGPDRYGGDDGRRGYHREGGYHNREGSYRNDREGGYNREGGDNHHRYQENYRNDHREGSYRNEHNRYEPSSSHHRHSYTGRNVDRYTSEEEGRWGFATPPVQPVNLAESMGGTASSSLPYFLLLPEGFPNGAQC